MTDNERELLLMIAKSIQNLEQDCAKQMKLDRTTSQSFRRRQELIELVEADAYGQLAEEIHQLGRRF